jgi:hypothetical protein
MSTTFPHFSIPTKNDGVGRHFGGGKLSTVIPARFPLCGRWICQKNFCPIYPRGLRMFPPGYPRNHPHAKTDVENLVEKRWNNPKKGPQ